MVKEVYFKQFDLNESHLFAYRLDVKQFYLTHR